MFSRWLVTLMFTQYLWTFLLDWHLAINFGFLEMVGLLFAHLVFLVSAEISYAVLLEQLVIIFLGKLFFPGRGWAHESRRACSTMQLKVFGGVQSSHSEANTSCMMLGLQDTHHVISSSSSSRQRKRWFSRTTSWSVLSLALWERQV